MNQGILMNYWLFKGYPSNYGVDSTYYHPGATGTWWTARPRKNWARGDRVFFWKASPALEIILLGEISRLPRRPRADGYWYVGVRYLTRVLSAPVGIDLIRATLGQDQPSFTKSGPSGTLYAVRLEHVPLLYQLVTANNPDTSSVWPDLEGITRMVDVDISGVEGNPKLLRHLIRERDPLLVRAKKDLAKQNPNGLRCEVCSFSFAETYGQFAADFCEVHHIKPLSERTPGRTHLKDLAILCSNCHRAIHLTKPIRTIHAFRRLWSARREI